MNSAITDHNVQIENPAWSPATVQIRLRRAIALFPASQATGSSGSQSVRRGRCAMDSPVVLTITATLGNPFVTKVNSRCETAAKTLFIRCVSKITPMGIGVGYGKGAASSEVAMVN